jgi:hypothetical protein
LSSQYRKEKEKKKICFWRLNICIWRPKPHHFLKPKVVWWERRWIRLRPFVEMKRKNGLNMLKLSMCKGE